MSEEQPAKGGRRRRRRRSRKKSRNGTPAATGVEAAAEAGAVRTPDGGDASGADRPNGGDDGQSVRGSNGSRAPRSQSKANGSAPHRQRGRYAHTYGAIDLGTNNCRLLVARPTKDGFRVIDAYSRIVRLGEGVGRTGELSDAAMDRAIDALSACADKMAKRQVTRSWSIATQACRLAGNGTDFRDAVKDKTGITLDIISPEREARLAVAGCEPLIEPDTDRALVFDIGGGSTELIWLEMDEGRPRIADWISLGLGVVTLAESHNGLEVDPDGYQAMLSHVSSEMAGFVARYGTANGAQSPANLQVLGTSGTVTTLAGMHLGLKRYDRARVDGVWMPRAAVHDLSAKLAAMPYEERIKQPCIGEERGDLVVAGCAILEAICQAWPTDQLRVADRGLREGMLLSLMERADKEARNKRRRRGGRNRRRTRKRQGPPQSTQTSTAPVDPR